MASQTIDGVTYAYVAPAERQQRISGYAKLRVGDTREEVRALLGAPDLANAIHERQSDKFAGWHYIYVYRTVHPDKRWADSKDQLVQVFFDPSGDRLTWAHTNNIPDLSEVGSQPP